MVEIKKKNPKLRTARARFGLLLSAVGGLMQRNLLHSEEDETPRALWARFLIIMKYANQKTLHSHEPHPVRVGD